MENCKILKFLKNFTWFTQSCMFKILYFVSSANCVLFSFKTLNYLPYSCKFLLISFHVKLNFRALDDTLLLTCAAIQTQTVGYIEPYNIASLSFKELFKPKSFYIRRLL